MAGNTPQLTSDRLYFLALGEYQRRRVDPMPALELAAHELKVSSQNGEDGVIQEIFRRTGIAARPYFVEFGVSYEGNAVLLADALGWAGLFIEADPDEFASLKAKYAHGPVCVRSAMITPGNIENLLREAGVPDEPDLLSIDIDGEDYRVWAAIETFRPRLLIIEYNSVLPAAEKLVQREGTGAWDATEYMGSSLGALADLGARKGYRLVHTDIAGVNAFFVRADLGGEWGEPRAGGPNYGLRGRGHPPDPQHRDYLRVSDVGR